MAFNLLIIIILITVLISIYAFSKPDFLIKMSYMPYAIKHYQQFHRAFTHVFVHVDMTHLIFNMLSLFFLGEFLQIVLIQNFGFIKGGWHFMVIYFVGGFFATLWPYLRHKDNPAYRSLGASGAVSSVIFAAIIWNPKMELFLMFLPIPIPAYIFGPLYLGLEFYLDRKGKGNIAHDAHIGGALFGIVYILLIQPEKGKEFLNLFFA